VTQVHYGPKRAGHGYLKRFSSKSSIELDALAHPEMDDIATVELAVVDEEGGGGVEAWLSFAGWIITAWVVVAVRSVGRRRRSRWCRLGDGFWKGRTPAGRYWVEEVAAVVVAGRLSFVAWPDSGGVLVCSLNCT
jgi:hypothetical protein